MFVGREAELQQLTEVFAKPGKQAVMLYGRRRVGKSTLILEAIKNIGRLQVQVEQNLSSNYISGIHLIKKSVEQFIRSVVA